MSRSWSPSLAAPSPIPMLSSLWGMVSPHPGQEEPAASPWGCPGRTFVFSSPSNTLGQAVCAALGLLSS